ncbi:MAG: alpha/beta hydrolase [Actinobacteria bacterium]|nr:alpha/beta hydrolase [Actinomycetota bacterium]
MRRSGVLRRLLLTALSCALATAGPGGPAAAQAGAPEAAGANQAPPLEWEPCGGDTECAGLIVPLDYAAPDGATLTIAVSRVRASGERRGAIIVNPGGPGMPGTSYAANLSSELPPEIGEVYDFVGFDPRGVGDSSKIVCMTQRELRAWTRLDATPDTVAEARRFARIARSFGSQCLEAAGGLLPHVGSRDTARDIDMLRAALGDDRLHFIGGSYGTYLGVMYADQFPERVGHLVLDGAIDPRVDQVGLTDRQITGFDEAAARMAAWCAARGSCPVPGRTTQGVIRNINRLLEDLDAGDLPVSKGPSLRQQEAIVGILAGLYGRNSWRLTIYAIGRALDGDGTVLASMSRSFPTSQPPFYSAFLAVSCVDSPAPPGRGQVSRWARERAGNTRVPEIARFLAWGVLPCSTWPVHADEPPGPVRAVGAPPILVIGTTHDPATPMRWARSLARQLDSGALLTHASDVHTAIGSRSPCVTRAVAAYLLDDRLPRPGTVCR